MSINSKCLILFLLLVFSEYIAAEQAAKKGNEMQAWKKEVVREHLDEVNVFSLIVQEEFHPALTDIITSEW